MNFKRGLVDLAVAFKKDGGFNDCGQLLVDVEDGGFEEGQFEEFLGDLRFALVFGSAAADGWLGGVDGVLHHVFVLVVILLDVGV